MSIVLNLLSSFGSISMLKTASSEAIRDALYRAATVKGVTVGDALQGVKKIADQEAAKVKLYFRH